MSCRLTRRRNSSDRKTLAVANRSFIRLLDVSSGTRLHDLKGHRSKVASLAFTPDGRHLISGSWDCTVRIWPMDGGEPTAFDWERGKVQYVAVAPDGMTVAAACDNGVVLWDLDA